jgi:hypothetical protein
VNKEITDEQSIPKMVLKAGILSQSHWTREPNSLMAGQFVQAIEELSRIESSVY